ncbi:MAG: DUF302 domain-containing protein [Methanobacterium sp.]
MGLSMPNAKLIIFGNPKGSTAFMLADVNFSMDLPLKIVVRKNNSKTELVYQTMEELEPDTRVLASVTL